jgi:thioredoxin 1
MKAVTDTSFTSDVLQSDKPVLVDFWADWCQPCRKVQPLLEEIAKELGDQVEIVKLDIDANPEVTRAYQVMSVPTLTMFRAGRPVNQLVGARPKGDLLKLIESIHQRYDAGTMTLEEFEEQKVDLLGRLPVD